MEECFIAAGKSWPDPFALSRSSPVRRSSDRAVMRREADEDGLSAIFLAHQLTHIQLAALTHLRRPGVSQMRIMRPDDNFCLPALAIEVRDKRIECLDHVTVAQVPRRYVFEKH